MKNQKTHAALLALVGGYILYIAYQLFSNMNSETETMPIAVSIAFIVVFCLAGIGVLAYALKTYLKKEKDDDGNNDDQISK